MERVRPIVDKKNRLGLDSWGTTDAGVRHIIGPIEDLFQQEFPDYQPFPFGVKRHIAQLVRHMLLSEPLLDEFAERFRGISAEDIDRLMRSFLRTSASWRDWAPGGSTSTTTTWCRSARRPPRPIASCAKRKRSWTARASSTAWSPATCSSSRSSRTAR
jgi:hypothetical protein